MTEPDMRRIDALDAAKEAFMAIGAGNAGDWRARMELRNNSDRGKDESNWKLTGLCSRALIHPDLPDALIERVKAAYAYFSEISGNR